MSMKRTARGAFSRFVAASTFPVAQNLTKSLNRIFVNKGVGLLDILKMTSGDVDLGLRSYHTKRRFHH